MFKSPRTISLRVPDVERAKQWYGGVLAQEPVLDAPFASVFKVGDCALVLLPMESPESPADPCVPFFGVDDIEEAYQKLLEVGATKRSEISYTFLKSRVATLADPFGNVLGIVSTAEEQKLVESRPSESAMTTAFSRALAARDDREGWHGPDHLAETFLNEAGKEALRDKVGREWIIKKMTGTHEYFLARTLYFDQIVQDALQRGVPQIALLGAGYDSRACRFKNLIRNTRIFEMDVATTQQRKREMLDANGISVPEQLVYVTINFEKDTIADVLISAGFDQSRETLFIWEGVTYYLTAQSVDSTLESVRRNAPSGSTLCFDYMIEAPDMASRHGVKEVLEAWKNAYSSEPVRFGIEEGTIDLFLSRRGYQLVEHWGPKQLEQQFLTRGDGSLSGRVVALFGIVRALVSN